MSRKPREQRSPYPGADVSPIDETLSPLRLKDGHRARGPPSLPAVKPIDPLECVDRLGLAERFRCSLSTIDKLRTEPDFPKPFALSERRRAWRVKTVAEWLTARERASA